MYPQDRKISIDELDEGGSFERCSVPGCGSDANRFLRIDHRLFSLCSEHDSLIDRGDHPVKQFDNRAELFACVIKSVDDCQGLDEDDDDETDVKPSFIQLARGIGFGGEVAAELFNGPLFQFRSVDAALRHKIPHHHVTVQFSKNLMRQNLSKPGRERRSCAFIERQLDHLERAHRIYRLPWLDKGGLSEVWVGLAGNRVLMARTLTPTYLALALTKQFEELKYVADRDKRIELRQRVIDAIRKLPIIGSRIAQGVIEGGVSIMQRLLPPRLRVVNKDEKTA